MKAAMMQTVLLFAVTAGLAGAVDPAWTFETGGDVYSSPCVGEIFAHGVYGTVYVGSQDKNVYAINGDTGEQIWNHTTGGIVYSSPKLYEGASMSPALYVGSYDGKVYCLNASTDAGYGGNLIWSFQTGPGLQTGSPQIISSPAVNEDAKLVYIGAADGILRALDAESGSLKWEFATGADIRSSPAFDKQQNAVFFGSYDHNMYALNASSGRLLWNYTTGGVIFSSPAVSETDGTVFVGSNDKTLYALNGESGAVKWNATKPPYNVMYSSPAVAVTAVGSGGASKELVYIGSNDHNVYAFDATDGSLVWKFNTGNFVESSPAVSNNAQVVYVGSDDGYLYVLDASRGVLLWTMQTGLDVASSPAVLDNTIEQGENGLVFVGSDDHKLYAMNGPSAGSPANF